jgi:hypothetical protein
MFGARTAFSALLTPNIDLSLGEVATAWNSHPVARDWLSGITCVTSVAQAVWDASVRGVRIE